MFRGPQGSSPDLITIWLFGDNADTRSGYDLQLPPAARQHRTTQGLCHRYAAASAGFFISLQARVFHVYSRDTCLRNQQRVVFILDVMEKSVGHLTLCNLSRARVYTVLFNTDVQICRVLDFFSWKTGYQERWSLIKKACTTVPGSSQSCL